MSGGEIGATLFVNMSFLHRFYCVCYMLCKCLMYSLFFFFNGDSLWQPLIWLVLYGLNVGNNLSISHPPIISTQHAHDE